MGEFDKYSKDEEKVVSADWASVLPSMKKFRPLRFHNRVGPLVVGVYLVMNSGRLYYTPKCYVHNLCHEFPCLIAGLRVQGVGISPAKHQELFAVEAKRIEEKAYIPLSGDLSIDKIAEGYERYFLKPYKGGYTEYKDFALLCGWTRKPDLVEHALKIVYDELNSWAEAYFSDEGGFENWFKQLEEMAWDGDRLNEIYESELVKHKLEKLPAREIIL